MDLTFTNRFTRDLPADPVADNHRRQVHRACYSRVEPVHVPNPRLVAHSREMAAELGISEIDDDFVQVFTGNKLLEGMDPQAACYGGHQFGNWAGQLGDGRAISLGEIRTDAGQHWTLQLKGAGPTPYSRSADGLAVLRSSIREFLCSEAMHHLGVPTTRALSISLTGNDVMRDMFYDGRPALEPGAVVCRVAPSFTRFGNFEIFTSRGELDVLRQLADFTVRADFPHLGEPSVEVYIEWLREVVGRTAEMIVEWMRVGFVHGVMNTDNMSILGLTIDYGPYGWLEDFDPGWTPNTTDAAHRRYRFGHQPQIAHWNLVRLANAIFPLINDVEPLQQALDEYVTNYESGYRAMMHAKLGLPFDVDHQAANDQLIEDLNALLQAAETDMTIFFRRLATVSVDDLDATDAALSAAIGDAYYVAEQITAEHVAATAGWLRRYLSTAADIGTSDDDRAATMNAVNPKYVLRNYMAQLAIDQSEGGDHDLVEELLDVMRRPYDEQPDRERWAEKRPDWARSRPGCSQLSCSS